MHSVKQLQNAKEAYIALIDLGAPVHLNVDEQSHFSICGQSNFCKEYNNILWADYYAAGGSGEGTLDEHGINPVITAILEKYDLCADWYNTDSLYIYNA